MGGTSLCFFSVTTHLTPEWLWYNELLSVCNLNLPIQVTGGCKYKDLEQVYLNRDVLKH